MSIKLAVGSGRRGQHRDNAYLYRDAAADGERFAVLFDAIKRLIAEDDARKATPKSRIGFVMD